jgi:RHS repeat-associated protein
MSGFTFNIMNIIGRPTSDTLKSLQYSTMTLEQAYPNSGGAIGEEMPQIGEDPGGYPSQARILYWYHPDYIQNVDLVTDLDGEAYELFLYNPWGEQLHHWSSNSSSWTSPYRFNAKEVDPETGLAYYGARYYQNKIGVWLSVDPLAYMRVEWSSYNFSSKNPINRIDPTGMIDDDIFVNTSTKQVSIIKTNDNFDRVIVDGKNTGNTNKGEFKSTYKDYKTNELEIKYSSSANKNSVSDYSTSVLVDIMNQSGESSIQINSTARSVEDQVRIMAEMVESRGMIAQKKMYADYGDRVLDKYPDRIAMIEMAKTIGPSKISKHCADLDKMNVVDVSPVNGGIKNAQKFSSTAQRNSSVGRVLSPWTPTIDPAIHIEIPQK